MHQGAAHEGITPPACRLGSAGACPANGPRLAGRRFADSRPSAAGRERFRAADEPQRPIPQISYLVEPLGPDDEVDYRYLYGLVVERREREEDRGKAIDAKVTSLLAGVVAFIGFSFRLQSSVWIAACALLYLVPLAFLLNAFMTKSEDRVPAPEALETFFPEYPTTTLRKAVSATVHACRADEAINNRKATRLDVATVLTAVVTATVLVTQVVLDLR